VAILAIARASGEPATGATAASRQAIPEASGLDNADA
jgi:hypothetical protein